MAMPPQPMRVGTIGHDCRGMAAVEFALILPAMLILLIGSFETANLVLAYMKLEASAETAADLLARTKVNTVLQSADFANFTNAAGQVLSPLPTDPAQLKIAYASITYSTGTPVIDWHYEANGAGPITVASISGVENLADLGRGVSGSSDSVVIVRLTYVYQSPISYVLDSSYTLSEWAFNRPRYIDCVPTYLNIGNTCP